MVNVPMRKRKKISKEKQIAASISVYDEEDSVVEEFTDIFKYLVVTLNKVL